MAKTKDDGGFAFPFVDRHAIGSHPGMTLRDWFAGQAMIGVIAADMGRAARLADDEGGDAAQMLAGICFAFVDEMLTERAKVKGDE